MRYLKMVRRNSKSVDQKKADRFKSMNYDPTLRNIKSKYVHMEQQAVDQNKHVSIQVRTLRGLRHLKSPDAMQKLAFQQYGRVERFTHLSWLAYIE